MSILDISGLENLTQVASSGISAPGVVIFPADAFECGCLVDWH